jgi:photosystem II stability/assembly factor-like uncharacterized protein
MIQVLSNWLKRLGLLGALAMLCVGCGGNIPSTLTNPWQLLNTGTSENLIDISFAESDQHVWAVGTNSTLIESTDGGQSWVSRTPELDQLYRLASISFKGKDGWIAGQPSVLLHTRDGGGAWERVPLSERLPGAPDTVVALGDNAAEMTTDLGAIYRTSDGGRNWKALVAQAVGVVRNIERAPDGSYVAVSSRGNFYSTWQPGQEMWEPHNRNSSLRVQKMGFRPDGNLWMLARGGSLQLEQADGEWQETSKPERTARWGLLDLQYRTQNEAWISGGSGTMLLSQDGGKTWQRDRDVEDVPSNFYKIKFFDENRGYVIGQRGVLMKYQPIPS